MAISGTDVLLLINTGTDEVPVYEVIGCQRDVTFDQSRDVIDVSCKTEEGKPVLAGPYEASLSLDSLYSWTDDGYQQLRTVMRSGDLVLVARQEGGVVRETAMAMVMSMSESFPHQAEGTFSVELRISGVWSAVGS